VNGFVDAGRKGKRRWSSSSSERSGSNLGFKIVRVCTWDRKGLKMNACYLNKNSYTAALSSLSCEVEVLTRS